MKYEMIFGDETLFDGATESMDIAISHPTIGKGFANSSECVFLSKQFQVVAMRRIIKEPKRWTWEDKKAGRLPDVGCRVDFCHKLNTNWRTGEVKYIDNQVAVIKADDIDRPFVYEFDRVEFKPIETPAEKAQREEDEFVESTCRQNEPHSTLYSDGVRAAYRKLKGGE